MSLLSLPAELRLHIYSFILPLNPLSCPVATYSGLLYSCKAIHSELQPEILKRVKPLLRSIQVRCRAAHGDTDMQYNEPTFVKELYNMEFVRPIRSGLFGRDDPFMALFYLGFSSLTIISIDPDDDEYHQRLAERQDHWNRDFNGGPYHNNTSSLVKWLSPDRSFPKDIGVKRVRYTWMSHAQHCARGWAGAIRDRSGTWKVQLTCKKRYGKELLLLSQQSVEHFEREHFDWYLALFVIGVEIERVK